jgi:hypothetical protein
MAPWKKDRPSEDEARADADAVVQKQRVLTLSREMAVHASLLKAKALELKEMMERDTAH